MKNVNITISEDVISSIVRPISCFINEIESGTKFTHVALTKETKYTVKDGRFPTFVFASDKGGLYKFTIWDLKRFKYNGKAFLDYFVPEAGTAPSLATQFEVVKCEPALTSDGKRMYPPFCYGGYTAFEEISTSVRAKREEAGTDSERASIRIPQSAYDELFETDIREGYEDKYYRTLELDNPIIFVPNKDKK